MFSPYFLRRLLLAEGNLRLATRYGIRFSDALPEEPEEPRTQPDPMEVARAAMVMSLPPDPV